MLCSFIAALLSHSLADDGKKGVGVVLILERSASAPTDLDSFLVRLFGCNELHQPTLTVVTVKECSSSDTPAAPVVMVVPPEHDLAAAREAVEMARVANDAGTSTSTNTGSSKSRCVIDALTSAFAGVYTLGNPPKHVIGVFGDHAGQNKEGRGGGGTAAGTCAGGAGAGAEAGVGAGERAGAGAGAGDAAGTSTRDEEPVDRPAALVADILALAAAVDPKETHLTLFFDDSQLLDRTMLGDPQCADTYADQSHFNKAFTLKCLLSVGYPQDRSLQARLLARGVDARLYSTHAPAPAPAPTPAQAPAPAAPHATGTARRVRRASLDLHQYLSATRSMPLGCGVTAYPKVLHGTRFFPLHS
jgi:hypothetical protein